MDELPGFAVPTVFSFLDRRQTRRCACVSKEWKVCARNRIAEIRKQAAETRAQVCGVFPSVNETAY